MPSERTSIHFTVLEDYVYDNRLNGDSSLHGLEHWHQVEFNGLMLAKKTHADETIIRLFALFHDSRRVSDDYDEFHGKYGAEYAEKLRAEHFFDLDEERFAQLLHACRFHTTENASGDATIDTCYDADRLDLGRVGIVPAPEKMATKFGKEIAGKLQRIASENHRSWIRDFALHI